MRECVEEAGATLLHIHLHPFTPEGVAGVSGVAVLAESHISIHTWPERRFAALDVFMCGDAKPEKCVEVLRRRFNAGEVRVNELLRGSNL
jgi:S-adenosylmethionine decarboxylase